MFFDLQCKQYFDLQANNISTYNANNNSDNFYPCFLPGLKPHAINLFPSETLLVSMYVRDAPTDEWRNADVFALTMELVKAPQFCYTTSFKTLNTEFRRMISFETNE